MRYKHDDVVCVWCIVDFDLQEKHAVFYGLSCMTNMQKCSRFLGLKTQFGVSLCACLTCRMF